MEMEPVLIVFFLFVLFPAVIFKGIARIKAAKATAQASSAEEMTASDLRAIIHEAVEDALAPLSARVADLEERLGDESVEHLRARLDPALLADLVESDLTDEHGEATAAVRRRTR
jgi:hypothetical protein